MTTCGLAQSAAGGVRCTRVQDTRVAGGASDGLRRSSAAQAEADGVNVLVSVQSRAMPWVEPPQPRVVHVRITELGKARACRPGALTLMHLQQALRDARVNVCSDDALDLGALARVRVFFVTITIIWWNAPGVTRGGGRQVPHGQLRAREHVLPEEMTFRKGLIKLGEKLKSSGSGESEGKARQSFVRACVILRHDRFTRGPHSRAEMVHHGGHKGAR